MRTSYFLFSVLLAAFFLAGCAGKDLPLRPEPRFPERPAARLAKTPEQGLAETKGRKNFTVNGGWGYNQKDAFVLTVPKGQKKQQYNNTIPLESMLVRMRNEVEFSGTPPAGQRYVLVDEGKIERKVSTKEGRMFAVWRGQMYLLAEKEAPELYRAAVKKPLMRRATSDAKLKSRPVPREFWFDVTDTVVLPKKR